jgi:hypothetical protein
MCHVVAPLYRRHGTTSGRWNWWPVRRLIRALKHSPDRLQLHEESAQQAMVPAKVRTVLVDSQPFHKLLAAVGRATVGDELGNQRCRTPNSSPTPHPPLPRAGEPIGANRSPWRSPAASALNAPRCDVRAFCRWDARMDAPASHRRYSRADRQNGMGRSPREENTFGPSGFAVMFPVQISILSLRASRMNFEIFG